MKRTKINKKRPGLAHLKNLFGPSNQKFENFFQDLKAGEELFTHYDISLDKAGIKNALHVALGVGQWYTGMPKKDFVNEVKPYLKMAANMADQLDVNHLLGFN